MQQSHWVSVYRTAERDPWESGEIHELGSDHLLGNHPIGNEAGEHVDVRCEEMVRKIGKQESEAKCPTIEKGNACR